VNWQVSNPLRIESLGELEQKPGVVQVARIPVAKLPDGTEMFMPILVGEGRESGPTLLMTALIHGIEIGGYDVINRLMKEELDFKRVRGRVIAVPIVNPFALGVSNRFTPQDSADLNRVFPGSAAGTLSQRVAHTLVDRVVKEADYVIDFHSCNPPSYVFTIVEDEGKEDDQQVSFGMAKAFGAITVAPAGHSPGTFSGHLSAIGKPVITPELVFSRRFDPDSSQAGVLGTKNVMKYLGMLDGHPEPLPNILPFSERLLYTAYYANTGGFIYFRKHVGDSVEKDEVFATVHNAYGEKVDEMNSPVTGLIIAYPLAGNQAVTTGDKVAYFASKQ
jgi:predicted deacylase